MILEIIQLVKYLLKRFKHIKRNKKCRNNKKERYTSKQKELLNLFNDLLLDAILTNETLKSKSQDDSTLMSSKEDDEMDNTLMSSKEDNENDKTLMSSKDGDDKPMNQNNNNIIKQLDDSLEKIIDKSNHLKIK